MATQRKYSIYVFQLGHTAANDTAFEHSMRDPRKPCLYVGSTAKSIEERYDEHVSGKRTSRAARKHGVGPLRPDLAAGKYAYSREKAQEIEARVAEALRREGYGVSQA